MKSSNEWFTVLKRYTVVSSGVANQSHMLVDSHPHATYLAASHQADAQLV